MSSGSYGTVLTGNPRFPRPVVEGREGLDVVDEIDKNRETDDNYIRIRKSPV